MASPVSLKAAPDFIRLEAIAKRIKSGRVRVGYPLFSGTYPDGTSVTDVAIWNEFGTSIIPERPFFRTTFTKNSDKYATMSKDLMQKVIDGRMSVERALGVLGVEAVADVQENIVNTYDPPNAPRTLAAKAPKTHPLINTGLLRQSVTYKVDA